MSMYYCECGFARIHEYKQPTYLSTKILANAEKCHLDCVCVCFVKREGITGQKGGGEDLICRGAVVIRGLK